MIKKTNVGTKIYGYCNGFFGRDDYADKIIIFETICGIVCSYLTVDDDIVCANFDSEEDKCNYIQKWSLETSP